MSDRLDDGGSGPLRGVRVLEYGDLVNAPYAAKILADLGADVLKIERPGTGDRSRAVGPFPDDEENPEASGLFLYLNGRKRGVTLDLSSARGREMFDELLVSTDILIENATVREFSELGLSPERLRALNDRLIHLSITPFGHTGPYASFKGYGLNAAAMSGVPLSLGWPDRSPLPMPDFLEDFFVGVVGAMSCMLALWGSEQDQRGEWVDLSGAETWMTYQAGLSVLTWLFGTRQARREGWRRTGGPYPSSVMHCSDGEMRVVAVTMREWRRFLDVMGTPAWSADPRFQDRLKMNELYADELDALIHPWLMARTKSQLMETFYEAGVPFTPIKDFGDVYEDPHLRARGFFVATQHAGIGPLEMPGAPYHFANDDLPLWEAAPALGQCNEEVFEGQLGMTSSDLSALREAGVI